MSAHHQWLKQITKFSLIMMLAASMSACSGSMSWKEEVLLQDGQKIIVERTVERGGRHEIGQQPPIKNQNLSFTLPSTNEKVTWEDNYTQDVDGANFLPKLLEVRQDIAYLVASPMGCLSYNKWGRPNPPYVIFKYHNKKWDQITLQALPAEIKTPNLIPSSPDNEVEKLGTRLVKAETIQKLISEYKQPEYRTILREAVKGVESGCVITDYYGKAGWLSPDWFTDQPSLQACLKFCVQRGIVTDTCPCNSIFKGRK